VAVFVVVSAVTCVAVSEDGIDAGAGVVAVLVAVVVAAAVGSGPLLSSPVDEIIPGLKK
jgi:hypothetical protein